MQPHRFSITTILALVSSLALAMSVNADDLVSEDTCIIEVQAPPGARVTLDGKNYGTQRTITYRRQQKGTAYPVEAIVRLLDGKRVEKQLLLKGGWRVRLPVATSTGDRPELVLQTSHANRIRSLAVSPDGRLLASKGGASILIWRIEGRTLLRRIEGVGGDQIQFSPDGRYIYGAISSKEGFGVWHVETGRRVRTFNIPVGITGSFNLTPDGKSLISNATRWALNSGTKLAKFETGRFRDWNKCPVVLTSNGRHAAHPVYKSNGDSAIAISDAKTLKRIHVLNAHKKGVIDINFSPDGKRLATVGKDDKETTLRIWNVDTGAQITNRRVYFQTQNVVFSPSGQTLVSVDCRAIRIRDGKSGLLLKNVLPRQPYGWQPQTAVFSTDGKLLIVAGHRTIRFYNFKSGREIPSIESTRTALSTTTLPVNGDSILGLHHNGLLRKWNILRGNSTAWQLRANTKGITSAVSLSANGRFAITNQKVSGFVKSYSLWDIKLKRELKRFSRYPGHHVSPDGKSVLRGGYNDETVRVVDASTGSTVRQVGHFRFGVTHVCYSLEGKSILTMGIQEDSITAWDAKTGDRIWNVKARRYFGTSGSLALSPDGKTIAMPDQDIRLFDMKTGREGARFGRIEGKWETVVFSPDSRLLISDHVLWKLSTRKRVRSFRKWGGTPSFFSPDGRVVGFREKDAGSLHLWDVATGDLLCTIVSLNGGKDWLVVTPEGLFDGSEGGMQKVMFRIGKGLNVVPVSRFFQDFHREGLLARIWRGERPMPNVDVSKSIPPTVKLLSPEIGGETGSPVVTLEVEVKDNGAGVKGPFLRHNGAKIGGAAKVQRIDAKTTRHTFTVKLLEGENRLRIEAASGDGAWESEPARISFTYSKSLPKPDLYIVAVGINKYAEDALKLSYAVPDATAISTLFSQRGSAFYEKVHVTRLLDGKATKTGIRQALRDVAGKAREQDTLLVYFSGHGFTVGQRYYFIPSEFQFAAKRFQDDVEDQGLPSNQIFQAMGNSKALKRVLVLDTCNSGAALKRSGTKKRSGFAFAGAIRRLARSQGIFTIAASSANDETAEIRELGHGVLTYSLLTGVRGVASNRKTTADGNGDGVVNISEWFGFAADEVPKLTKKYLGIQQNVQQRTEGVSFPVLPIE